MKKLMMAASAAVLLGASSLAHAGDATGTITSVDLAAGTVTLDGADTFLLPPTIDAGELKLGEKVTITFEEQDGKMTATDVTPIT
jgi:Cu/Ag efflux protein CusF